MNYVPSHESHVAFYTYKKVGFYTYRKYICIWGRTSSGNESFEDFADVVASLARSIIVHMAWWCESSREHCVTWSAIFSICLRLVALSWLSPSGDISSSLLDYVQDDSWSGPSYASGKTRIRIDWHDPDATRTISSCARVKPKQKQKQERNRNSNRKRNRNRKKRKLDAWSSAIQNPSLPTPP